MDEKFLKPYDSKETEDRIYALWEESGFFNPDVCIARGIADKDADYFSIVLPPPNVTGILHMGHSSVLTIEDIMVRYNRMRGKRTLWVPGTDHAAIATQTKVEKLLQKEKIRKQDLGREKFLERVKQFVEENRNAILKQIRKMGASVDWSRSAFTLDEKRSLAVKSAFKQMHDDGLIYRGYRIVNWDPKGQTVISDDEVNHEERKGHLYTFRYSKDFPFPIATTRPETKVGDTAVAVHPDDKRYKKYVGKKYEINFAGVPLKIRVVADEAVDPEFGTGAVGVTPAHSIADAEIAERHDLPTLKVINEYARMDVEAPKLKDKKTTEAREIIIQWLKKEDLLEKEEEIDQSIAVAERSGGIIEPLPKLQWFINVNHKFQIPNSKIKGIKNGQEVSLKELMLHVVKEGIIEIIPKRFEKTYFHWIENLRDWCISRQIWYGHRIPVWYDKDKNIHLPKEQKVIFTRHGQSEANAKKVIAGHVDSPLTDQGRDEAEKLAKTLKKQNITKIISSNQSRSKETAKIIARELGLQVETWEDFHEVNAGDVEGTPADPKRPFVQRSTEAGTGETLEEIETRAKGILQKLQQLDGGGDVLAVGHNTFTALLFATWNGLPKEKFVEYRKKWKDLREEQREITLLKEPQEVNLVQDPDTLDTWFSSGLWTFSTLGWPKDTEDLKNYHPTTVLETAYEILFFWVARMILMSTYLLGDIPFKNVYLQGLVRDEKGRKLSKSLGNNIDPIDMIEKYGSDAIRMSLIIGTGPGNDIKLSEDKIRAYKKFANKIWNATRFVIENTKNLDLSKRPSFTKNNKKDLETLEEFLQEITGEMEEYKYYLVGEKLYHYFWHTFADVIIEENKEMINNGTEEEKISAQYTLNTILTTLLKTLHPFMPFITEEIWGILPQHKNKGLLIVEPWPTKI